jgi:hypothetical protein
MGTFTYTHFVDYLGNGDGAGDPLASLSGGTLTDGDPDTTFEVGDTVSAGTITDSTPTSGQFLGTTEIDGVEWPVFYFPRDDASIVFLDQAPPFVLPSTLAVNETDTFDRACFLAGTRIATPQGETEIERLAPGDPILTADGREVPIRFVGRQRVLTAFGPAERLLPVRIRAGALGDGLPRRDLLLTGEHALLIDGLLVNAAALVDGDGIDWVPLREFDGSYTVYNVETEDHDVLLAEGVPAETFIDYVPRAALDNYQEYLELHGEDRTIPEMSLPRISAGRLVPAAIRARLSRPRAA